jgi:hypothetical protein
LCRTVPYIRGRGCRRGKDIGEGGVTTRLDDGGVLSEEMEALCTGSFRGHGTYKLDA